MRRAGIHIGRIAGIDVHLDFSLIIIFALIVFGLGAGYFPTSHPDWPTVTTWATALIAGVLFFGSVLLHELAHGIVGNRVGVPVRRITLFLFGGLAHMEGSPETPRAELQMTVVGPITSLLLGIGFSAVGVALAPPNIELLTPAAAAAALSPASTLCLWLGSVNIVLAAFNMIPGFPLDGGRVLRAILWWSTNDLTKATRWASGVGRGFGWLLMATGVMMAFGLVLPFVGGGMVSGLWLVLIGWFLSKSARISYQRVVIKDVLTDVPVARLMKRRFEFVPSDATLSTFVEQHVMQYDQRCFPVVGNVGLSGLVCIEDVRKVPRDRWSTTRVSDVMTRADELSVVKEQDGAHEALTELGLREVDQLPVVGRDGGFVGLIRRKDIIRFLTLHEDAIASA